MSKNIVDAYKDLNGQFIIVVSGLSGSGKTELGKNISRDFKIQMLDTKKFYREKFDETIILPNKVSVINYDTDNAFNWDDMNDEVNRLKTNGVVVVGNVFPTDKLNFKADYHILLKISKQELKKNRIEYIEKHPEKGFNIETETLRINAVTYPYYLDAMKRMKIDKFVDVGEMSDDELYDTIFDGIIGHIKNNVYKQGREMTEPNESSEEIIPYNSDYIVSYKDDS